MITETRKQIIELIEPYMDKTLSEGCLFLMDNTNTVKIFHTIIGKDDHKEEYTTMTHNTKGRINPKSISKILGHYDITAVLKYIRMKDFYMENGEKYIFVSYHKGNLIGSFPNKPLTIYTEQEEKDLLELLLKLGENQKK